MQDEPDIRDDAQHVGLVFLVKGHGVVVVGGHQDLGTGAFPETLLAFVQGVADGRVVLLDDETVQFGQIRGVVSDRILHQQDALDAVLQDVHGGVPAVLQELDDGDDEVRGVVPAEDAVEMSHVPVLHLLVDLLREGGQKDDGSIRSDFLGAAGELEHVDFAHVVHRDDQVVALRTSLHQLQGFHGGLHAVDHRRAGEVELGILGGDPGLDPSVLFQGELVVVVAHKEDPADPTRHQGRNRFSHRTSVR